MLQIMSIRSSKLNFIDVDLLFDHYFKDVNLSIYYKKNV